MTRPHHPSILTIAGSDSGGGAGIQADLKTITALNGYGLSVITALTAQNTRGVTGIFAPDADFVAQQLNTVLDDFDIRAAKTGMLFSEPIIEALHAILRNKTFPLVVDPVCVSQTGHRLLQEEAIEALRTKMVPLADILTPNRPEAETLTGREIQSESDILDSLKALLDMGASAVLLKGGHFHAEVMTDWLAVAGSEPEPLVSERIPTRHTHGTGCTLSAAMATHLGFGLDMREAVIRAREYLQLGLWTAYPVGRGDGPVNHLTFIDQEKSRVAILEDLHQVGRILQQLEDAARLVPEVRMNIALSVPYARRIQDVAAFDGRITSTRDGRVLIPGCPRFGASSHMAKVVLAASSINPSIRAAVNIRANSVTLEAVRNAGLVLVQFDRSQEPQDLKEREGSTLEWGTLKALAETQKPDRVDAIHDEGEKGKEPMIRLLGTDLDDLVEKIQKVLANLP